MKLPHHLRLLAAFFILHSAFYISASAQETTALPPLAALSTYEYGDSLAPQLACEKYFRTATSAQRAAAETKLIALIISMKTTTAAKRVFLTWLGWIGTGKSIPMLTNAAENPDLAHAAISALAAINTDEADDADDALISMLPEMLNAEATRIEAANALGQRRASNLVAASATDFNMPPQVLAAALEAVSNIGISDADFESLREHLPEITTPQLSLPQARVTLAGIGNALRRAPAEKADTMRETISKFYGLILTVNTDPAIRVETAQALITLDPTNAALIPFLSVDTDPRLLTTIATGLAISGDKAVVKLLTDHFAAFPANIQSRVMRSLSTTPNATAFPLITMSLASTDDTVRLAALAAAGACGNEETVPLLIPFLASENKDISTAAFAALTQLPDCDGKVDAALEQQIANSAPPLPQLIPILAKRRPNAHFQD